MAVLGSGANSAASPWAHPELILPVWEQVYGNEYLHLLQLEPVCGGHRAYVYDGPYNIFTKRGDLHQAWRHGIRPGRAPAEPPAFEPAVPGWPAQAS